MASHTFNTNRFLLHRIAYSPRTSLIQLFMWPGLVVFEFTAARIAVNDGTSLSTVLNARLPSLLMVLCSYAWRVKVLIASAILKGTATTFTRERCAWDSGSAIVLDMEMLMPPQVGFQCPESL